MVFSVESPASGSVNFICKACPNGCRLQLKRKDVQTVLIHGNGCVKGIAYAYSSARQEMPGHCISTRNNHQFKKEDLEKIVSFWGKRIVKVQSGLFIQGSPERSGFRTVVTDDQGVLFVLETIGDADRDRKHLIVSRLRVLHEKGMAVTCYERGLNGEEIQQVENNGWLMTRFVKGIPLDRNTYWRDGWRGRAL